jgi:pilus assembly protein CpaF
MLEKVNRLQTLVTDYFQSEGFSNLSRSQVHFWVKKFYIREGFLLPKTLENSLIEQVVFNIIGLGPLEFLLSDASVSEIMVNGAEAIFVERGGRIERTEYRFADEKQLRQVIGQIVGKAGKRIDEKNPLVDARLDDGSRINAVLPPLSTRGAVLTIRKFPEKSFTLNDMIQSQTLSQEMADYLSERVRSKKNIVVSGGTGAGKTSTLNALASKIPAAERIITIEDTAEMRIDHPHLITLEAREANIEGKGAITIRQLLKNALRMRPDRIVVGEIRGGEAIDMLQAMNTGHQGSLTTVHANAPLESLYRLETMVLMGDVALPLSAIRPQISQAIDIVIQQNRFPDGSRRITHISEVCWNPVSGDEYQIQDRFVYQSGKFQKTC